MVVSRWRLLGFLCPKTRRRDGVSWLASLACIEKWFSFIFLGREFLARCPRHTSNQAHVNCHWAIEKQCRAILCLSPYTKEWHDNEVLIITSCPVCPTQSSFSFSLQLDSLFGCFLFTYRPRKMRNNFVLCPMLWQPHCCNQCMQERGKFVLCPMLW